MLTKKKAIEISIELWTWLAETGVDDKGEWEGWEKYGDMDNTCALCEYSNRLRLLGEGSCEPEACGKCPYYQAFGFCWERRANFDEWRNEKLLEERKKYATLFLEQLKELK